MAEAKTLKEYEEFGKGLVSFGVSQEDLMTRINSLTTASDDQIKSVVTGFIDALGEEKDSESDFYKIVHGFGKFLYNGNFQDMRSKALERILARAIERDDDSLIKWLSDKQGDHDALTRICEMAIEKSPTIAYHLHPKEGRKEALRKIVDKHYSPTNLDQTIVGCLRELEDTDKLRELARENVTRASDFAFATLAEHGTEEDLREAIKTWQSKNIDLAYHANEFLIDRRRREKQDYDRREELQKLLIRDQPKTMFDLVRYEHQSHDRWYRRNIRGDEKKDLLIALGKRFLEMDDFGNAVEAFNSANYEGPEYEQIGMHALKNHDEFFKDDRENYRKNKYKCAMRLVARRFFEEGGDVETAIQYMDMPLADDDLRRKMARAFADLPKDKHARNATRAYQLTMLIKDKTPSDQQKIYQLRERVLEEDDSYWAVRVFSEFDDKVGIQGYLNKNLRRLSATDTYRATLELGVEGQIDIARRRLIKENGQRWAFHTFKEEKDETGMKYVQEELTKGIDPEIAKKLIQL